MTPERRVVFFSHWSSWHGERGRVVDTGRPGLWVLIDGDTAPVAVSVGECIPEDESTVRMVAGE